MKQTNYQKHTHPLKKQLNQIILIATILIPLLTTACSTMNPKRETLMHVLDEQNDLLRKLQAERQSDAVVQKVQSDPTLSRAESHLDQAIQSLIDSNTTVKSAL